ncbi:MAG: response regulator transcription factor [Gammaproteobacteria bacterium]|nr:response regulator transcription factor [Gammaproteobacteria bacterium]
MLDVLLIDDDEKLAPLLQEYCRQYDIQIQSATRPSSGLEQLDKGGFDAVILDVMLPEMDGFEVCRTIRRTNQIPIIMLTARGDVTDRVVGLEIGADDYLPKPFEPRELVARINTIVKRKTVTPEQDDSVLEYEDLTINQAQREVTVRDKAISLTTMEYQLLLLLANSPGKDFSRDDILNALKGTETELFSRSVDILVSRLRSKLKPAAPIKTVYGAGYAFVGKRA